MCTCRVVASRGAKHGGSSGEMRQNMGLKLGSFKKGGKSDVLVGEVGSFRGGDVGTGRFSSRVGWNQGRRKARTGRGGQGGVRKAREHCQEWWLTTALEQNHS